MTTYYPIRYGNLGESYVARQFRKAKFTVRRSPKSIGVFDMVATRDGLTVAVQVKTYALVSAFPKRPFAMHTRMMGADLPPNAIRLLWCHCPESGYNALTKIVPTGFERVSFADLVNTCLSNPIGNQFPQA